MRTPDSDLLQAALEYADRGWPVHPLVPRNKRPLTKNGLLDASTDPGLISGWWSSWPLANIGLRTGVTFDVLDIDGEVGHTSLEAAAGSGFVHPGPVSRTGRGEHWLYQSTGMSNHADRDRGLDWRGKNGYIVAPPSRHPSGHNYEWSQPTSLPLPDIPEWASSLFAERAPAKFLVVPQKYDSNNDIVKIAIESGLVLRSEATRYATRCPFHTGDNQPSLKLYPHDNSYHCYGCGAHGWARDLRQRLRTLV